MLPEGNTTFMRSDQKLHKMYDIVFVFLSFCPRIELKEKRERRITIAVLFVTLFTQSLTILNLIKYHIHSFQIKLLKL